MRCIVLATAPTKVCPCDGQHLRLSAELHLLAPCGVDVELQALKDPTIGKRCQKKRLRFQFGMELKSRHHLVFFLLLRHPLAILGDLRTDQGISLYVH